MFVYALNFLLLCAVYQLDNKWQVDTAISSLQKYPYATVECLMFASFQVDDLGSSDVRGI